MTTPVSTQPLAQADLVDSAGNIVHSLSIPATPTVDSVDIPDVIEWRGRRFVHVLGKYMNVEWMKDHPPQRPLYREATVYAAHTLRKYLPDGETK